MERTAKKNFIIDVIYTVIILVIIYLICKFLLTYLLPFLLATLVAFLVQPFANFLSKKTGVKKGTVAALVSVAVYLILATLLAFAVYRIIIFAIGFTQQFPSWLNKLDLIFEKIQAIFLNLFSNIPKEFNFALNSILENMVNKFANGVGGFISSIATTLAKKTPSFLISSIVALVATFYIAKDYNGLLKFINQLMGKERQNKISKIKKILFESVFKLAKGYLILCGITYLELLLGLLLLGVNYAPLIALIIAFVDLLPVIGTGTVMIPWAIFSVFSGNAKVAIGLGILYIIIVVVRNILEPKVISVQIGINPLFTLLSMFVGLKVLGVWGLILFPIILIVVIRYYKDEMQEGLAV